MFTITAIAMFIGMCWTAEELGHKEDLGTLHKAHGRNCTGPAHWSTSTSC